MVCRNCVETTSKAVPILLQFFNCSASFLIDWWQTRKPSLLTASAMTSSTKQNPKSDHALEEKFQEKKQRQSIYRYFHMFLKDVNSMIASTCGIEDSSDARRITLSCMYSQHNRRPVYPNPIMNLISHS